MNFVSSLILICLVNFSKGLVEVPLPIECDLYRTETEFQFLYKCNILSFNTYNFSALPTEFTYMLSLTCIIGEYYSELSINTFNHLTNLQALQINQCDIKKIDFQAFFKLKNLVSIEITSISKELQASRSLPNGLFDFNSQLQKAAFTLTNLSKIPENLFCNNQLQILEFHGNKIKTLDGIGCGLNNTCCPTMVLLYVTNDILSEVLVKDLSNFPVLYQLMLDANNIEFIEEGALDYLPQLNSVTFFMNRLKTIPINLFQKNPNLVIIDLGKNQLDEIDPNLFRGLSLLQLLDLQNNKIKIIKQGVFDDLVTLLELDLQGNLIEDLQETGVFKTQSSLKNLSLANNLLRKIGDNDFFGLKSLTLLNLSGNSLEEISAKAFSHIQSLTFLDMGNNKLKTMQNFCQYIPRLLTLDLRNNDVSEISNDSLRGLQELVGLRISANKIHTIHPDAFMDLNSLGLLNLRDNSITKIEGLHSTPNLRYLILANNSIEEQGTSLYKLSLEHLDLSVNLLTKFDFTLIPNSLAEINITSNRIYEIVDPRGDQKDLQLKKFLASNNNVEIFEGLYFPRSLEIIDLSNNQITTLRSLMKPPFPRLFRINLRDNKITEIDESDISCIPEIPDGQPMLELDLTGNFLLCSCKNVWLKKYRQFPSRKYPHITSQFNCARVTRVQKQHGYTFDVDSISKNDFLCNFKEAGSSAIIEVTCPPECTCYRSFDFNTIQVDCFNRSWNGKVPAIPQKTTQLFLDLNSNLPNIIPKAVENLPRLQILYVNKSSLFILPSGMLAGMPELLELHLEDNGLLGITEEDLATTNKLQELYLHNNNIRCLADGTFQFLKNLNKLTLNNNKLIQLKIWDLIPIPVITLTLSDNLFHCNCDFLMKFQQWINDNSRFQVIDLTKAICDKGWNHQPIMQINVSSCLELKDPDKITQLVIPVTTTVCFFIFLTVVSVLFYLYRLELQVWLYSRFRMRIFHPNDNADNDKVYDAFVSYANADDQWVANQLVPNLDGYRLCIHQRDFPVGAYIADSILDAVEKSCRILVVLSPNYIESEWCLFEFKSAHLKGLQDKCQRLIVTILEDVDLKAIDKELSAYMKTNTYLRCDDKKFWDKLKFALPDVKI